MAIWRMLKRHWRCAATNIGLAFIAAAALAHETPPPAGDDSVELAKELSNPIASLISVPVKLDWDTGIGAVGADRYTYVVQPVIPFSLDADWNLITRTITPIIDARSPVAGGHSESGLGDITQSFFFSPKAPTAGGWIWGAGPVPLYPSATNPAVDGEKWGAGPTAVLPEAEWRLDLRRAPKPYLVVRRPRRPCERQRHVSPTLCSLYHQDLYDFDREHGIYL